MALRADSHVVGDAASGRFGVDPGFCIHAKGVARRPRPQQCRFAWKAALLAARPAAG